MELKNLVKLFIIREGFPPFLELSGCPVWEDLPGMPPLKYSPNEVKEGGLHLHIAREEKEKTKNSPNQLYKIKRAHMS